MLIYGTIYFCQIEGEMMAYARRSLSMAVFDTKRTVSRSSLASAMRPKQTLQHINAGFIRSLNQVLTTSTICCS